MSFRGTYSFELSTSGNLIYSNDNIELLRKLWLDRKIISFEELGPGDPGDFDYGAWHSSCHLVAAGGVCSNNNGNLFWLSISFNSQTGLYEPSITFRESDKILTMDLNYAVAREYLQSTRVIGFVEGTSEGRISASGIIDDPKIFNNNPRQDYDQEPGCLKEGGKVWEHWCTLRDIRDTSKIANSVLCAYLMLTSILGDVYPATVLRGRKDYGHPQQLLAMIGTGFVSKKSALLNITPQPIPIDVEIQLKTADPRIEFEGIELLNWQTNNSQYYMFPRKIQDWYTPYL